MYKSLLSFFTFPMAFFILYIISQAHIFIHFPFVVLCQRICWELGSQCATLLYTLYCALYCAPYCANNWCIQMLTTQKYIRKCQNALKDICVNKQASEYPQCVAHHLYWDVVEMKCFCRLYDCASKLVSCAVKYIIHKSTNNRFMESRIVQFKDACVTKTFRALKTLKMC